MTDKNEWVENTGSTVKFEKKGDTVEGILVDIQSNVGQNVSMLYTVQNKEGDNVGVWGSTVLNSRMKGIKIGEEVKIVFEGLGDKSPGKNPPKLFKVFHRQPEGDEIPF